MLTRIGQLILITTAIAPIFFVYAAARVLHDWREAAAVSAAGALLFLICALLVRGGVKTAETISREVCEADVLDKEALAFLVAYALPVVASPKEPNLPAIAAFALVMGAVAWQQQLYHVNPLLAVLGYHFHSAKLPNGSRVLILSREKVLRPGFLTIVEFSRYLWFHHDGGSQG